MTNVAKETIYLNRAEPASSSTSVTHQHNGSSCRPLLSSPAFTDIRTPGNRFYNSSCLPLLYSPAFTDIRTPRNRFDNSR